MRKITAVMVLLCVLTVTACGCGEGESSADVKQRQATAKAMKEAHSQIGMPAIHAFQERKLAKMIFELRDKEGLVTYAYIVNRMKGELVFIGKCIGFGLPYSVQYTNPQRIVRVVGGARISMPQADPNGLFMPEGLSATWLMMIDPATKEPRPVYVEPQIVVSPFPLHGADRPTDVVEK